MNMMKIKIVKLCTAVFLLYFLGTSFCFSDTVVNLTKDEKEKIDFDAQLEFYLNMKTKRFLQKMSIKETFLLQLIENTTAEMNARGKERLEKDEVGFQVVFRERNKLIDSYTKEIDAIVDVINELENLEFAVKRSDDLKLLNEVDEIKENLSKTLDDRKLSKGRLTKQQMASLINEYSNEVDALVKLYKDIELFERKAYAIGDNEIVKQLKERKSKILQTLELSRMASPVDDKAVEEYISEATNLVGILKELDKLETEIEVDSGNASIDVESFRNRLIDNIDDRILRLFGYTSSIAPDGPSISEYFKQWKAKRVSEFQLKFTQYNVIRDQLIKTGKELERNRMLEREMSDALLNFTNEKYDLAILQFNEIYKGYKVYYDNLDGLIFYKSEASYTNGYFDEAYDGFQKLTIEYPNSQYVGKSYLRMMLISYTYGWYDKFFKYFKSFQGIANVLDEDFNEANYLAGFIYFKQRKFIDSRKILQKVMEDSKYSMASQYLSGIVYANLDNYTKSKKIFEQLIAKKNYPWTNINTAIIRNEALLKLGYLHYQRGEYNNAILYFEQVSKGYDKYDYSLMGQAWAKMKKGEYDATIKKVNLLTNNYLLSNYTYEGMVLSAHCKKNQNKTDEALKELRYVSDAKDALKQAEVYNEERKHILTQMKELERLEVQILERQDRKLYPNIVRIRNTINNALMSFYYRGSINSRVVEEFNNERKILIKQIEEFENIMKFAEEQHNNKMYEEAEEQRDRLLLLLEAYHGDRSVSNANNFVNYPLAVKEGGYIYRKEIVKKVTNELLSEKNRVKTDLEMITQLLVSCNTETNMEVMMDLEILDEDLRDLHNQLNRFQVWLVNHQIKEVQTGSEQWADFSGFGISDINYTTYQEQIKKMSSLSKNISNINEILKQKKELLEKRINLFDSELKKIQKEMKTEKIRLEKLEKEKYFRDIYFDTKTKEIETEEGAEYNFDLKDQGN